MDMSQLDQVNNVKSTIVFLEIIQPAREACGPEGPARWER